MGIKVICDVDNTQCLSHVLALNCQLARVLTLKSDKGGQIQISKTLINTEIPYQVNAGELGKRITFCMKIPNMNEWEEVKRVVNGQNIIFKRNEFQLPSLNSDMISCQYGVQFIAQEYVFVG